MTLESSRKEESKFNPAPREDWSLVNQGAEARVWKLSGNDGNVQWICKERFSKAYRHPTLDERLTKRRCRSEARVLEKCTKKSDIRVPRVVRVDPPLLYLEYMEGPTVKSYLKNTIVDENDGTSNIDTKRLAQSMGTLIGKLHNLGIVHGDLTTSNVMFYDEPSRESSMEHELVLIDFGLAQSTTSVEEQAVDLYVMERALQSSHPDLPKDFFDHLLNAYATVANPVSSKKNAQTTLQRLEQVRQRGRKRECFG